MRGLPLVLGLVASALAGCLIEPDSSQRGEAVEDVPAGGNLNAPRVDAAATLATLREFSTGYPYRQGGTVTHLASRDWLEARFDAAGLETLRHGFEATTGGTLSRSFEGQNIVGVKWGADRDNWIVVGAHYDIADFAVQGAYDDGSGTAQVVALGEAFADVNTTRTIAFVLFDQEERGLAGSRAFVRDLLEGRFAYDVSVDAMVDLDMVGITHPHPAPLVAWITEPQLQAWSEEFRQAAGVPDDRVEYREPRYGTSDGASFAQADVPVAYYWSNWDEVALANGMRGPGAYPFWHQADTYETMVVMAGGEATLRAGFQTVLDVVSPLVLRLASHEGPIGA